MAENDWLSYVDRDFPVPQITRRMLYGSFGRSPFRCLRTRGIVTAKMADERRERVGEELKKIGQ